MTAGSLAREGRRRAGLTQAELASRIGTTQSAVARLENDRAACSFERLARIARACGLELVPMLLTADDSDWSVASTNLRLDVDARVRQHQAVLRFSSAGRAAMAGRKHGA
jgi:transcriptional regulator with XRE-family HTH domain